MMNQYVHARRWAVTLLMGLVCLFAFAQGQNVTGTVTDPAGEPLIGVSVQVKGAKTGAITDFDGNFKLANVPAGSVLVFSYIGYLSQEIPVEKGKNAPLNVVLREDAQNLEEVVVIGYGSVKRRTSPGPLPRSTQRRWWAFRWLPPSRRCRASSPACRLPRRKVRPMRK